jgi:hypothetical protein
MDVAINEETRMSAILDLTSVTIGRNRKGQPRTIELGLLKELADGEELQPGERMFRIMTPEDGDKRLTWNARFLDQIAEAKRKFLELVQQGLVPHKVGPKGTTLPEVMTEFEEDAEEIIFLPSYNLVVGG